MPPTKGVVPKVFQQAAFVRSSILRLAVNEHLSSICKKKSYQLLKLLAIPVTIYLKGVIHYFCLCENGGVLYLCRISVDYGFWSEVGNCLIFQSELWSKIYNCSLQHFFFSACLPNYDRRRNQIGKGKKNVKLKFLPLALLPSLI